MSDRTPRFFRSLSGRFLALQTLLFLTIMGVVFFIEYVSLERSLDGQESFFITEKSHEIHALIRGGKPGDEAFRREVEWQAPNLQMSKVYTRVMSGDGVTLLETPFMGQKLPRDAFPPFSALGGETRLIRRGYASSGAPYLLLVSRATDASGRDMFVQLALDLRSHGEALASQRRILLAIFMVGLLMNFLLGRYLNRVGVRPILALAGQMDDLASGGRSTDIEAAQAPLELQPLIVSFNKLYSKLQSSIEQLSGFSADLAHELRTPLNILLGEADLTLARKRSLEEYERTLRSSIEEYRNLIEVVDGLLFIARHGNSRSSRAWPRQDLVPVIRKVLDFYEPLATEKELSLRYEGGSSVMTNADSALMGRAVSNLLVNAIRHAPPGTFIQVQLREEGGGILLEVVDQGVGIPSGDLARLGQRFYRVGNGADAVQKAYCGFGLGLAIVKTICEFHGASLEIESTPGVGSNFRIRLPRAKNDKMSSP